MVANSLGDPTAKRLGRLSLNPIPHIDIFGSIILPILSLFGAGLLIGYAKPVPYDPRNLSDKKFGPLKVALAGPVSNIILALLFGLVLRFLPDIFTSALVPEMFKLIISINLWLAIFNLFPIPPLDGHWILRAIFPRANWDGFSGYSIVLIFFLIFIIAPYIYPLVGWLYEIITGLPA